MDKDRPPSLPRFAALRAPAEHPPTSASASNNPATAAAAAAAVATGAAVGPGPTAQPAADSAPLPIHPPPALHPHQSTRPDLYYTPPPPPPPSASAPSTVPGVPTAAPPGQFAVPTTSRRVASPTLQAYSKPFGLGSGASATGGVGTGGGVNTSGATTTGTSSSFDQRERPGTDGGGGSGSGSGGGGGGGGGGGYSGGYSRATANTTSGAGSAAVADGGVAKPKKLHREVEQKRRMRMAEQILELRKWVSNPNGGKTDKVSVLQDAVTYVKDAAAKIEQLQDALERSRGECAHLRVLLDKHGAGVGVGVGVGVSPGAGVARGPTLPPHTLAMAARFAGRGAAGAVAGVAHAPPTATLAGGFVARQGDYGPFAGHAMMQTGPPPPPQQQHQQHPQPAPPPPQPQPQQVLRHGYYVGGRAVAAADAGRVELGRHGGRAGAGVPTPHETYAAAAAAAAQALPRLRGEDERKDGVERQGQRRR